MCSDRLENKRPTLLHGGKKDGKLSGLKILIRMTSGWHIRRDGKRKKKGCFLCCHCHKASVFQSEGKPIAVVSTLGYAAIRAFSFCVNVFPERILFSR